MMMTREQAFLILANPSSTIQQKQQAIAVLGGIGFKR